MRETGFGIRGRRVSTLVSHFLAGARVLHKPRRITILPRITAALLVVSPLESAPGRQPRGRAQDKPDVLLNPSSAVPPRQKYRLRFR